MKIEIAKIKVAERIRKEVSKIDELASDIKQNDLITPIAVMPNESGYQLLAGLRRLRAVQSLGWTEIEVNVISPANAEEQLRIEISENEQREPFTYSEKMDFAKLLEEVVKAKARERMLAGTADPAPQGAQGESGRTRDIVAAKIGMGKTNYDRAKYIANNAPPEIIEELDRGERTIRGTYDELRATEKAETAVTVPVVDTASIKTEPTAIPAQKFESPPIITPHPPKVKKLSDKEKEERAMAMLPPKEREVIERRRAFDAMTPEEKVVDLQRQLKEERQRATVAETELARLKDIHHNDVYHRDATIKSQRERLDSMQRQLKEAIEKIAELEGKTHAT